MFINHYCNGVKSIDTLVNKKKNNLKADWGYRSGPNF